MVGVVVAAHGGLAEALVAAAEEIVGPLPRLRAISFPPHEGLTEVQARIRTAVDEVDEGDGVVVLVDLFGGTPANCCLPLLDDGNLDIVTGVNLPMLMRLPAARERLHAPQELARDLAAYGQRNVASVRTFLGALEEGKER